MQAVLQNVTSTRLHSCTVLRVTVQVEEHADRESVWFVYEGKVYDGTKFLNDHPGGPESILIVGGQVLYPST